MKNLLKKLFILLLFSASFSVYAQSSEELKSEILSPISGTWSNKQMLVIDTKGDYEYFYSLDGSDPQTFGFAYDGPVLIDLTGEINLSIVKIGKNTVQTKINFTVLPDSAYNRDYGAFINSFYDSGIFNYTCGTVFQIPENLQYSFGLPPDSFSEGTELEISEKNILSRFIPCVIYDEVTGKFWRFVIKVYPQTAGVFSRTDVPFKITNWDTLTITNQDFIYKIDKEYWSLPKESIILDRSVSHMISWQALEYKAGNPVEFFILPPKPQLVTEKKDDGSCVYSLNGDASYSLGIRSSKNDYQELFKEIGADTFKGDSLNGVMELGVYANSVYQGSEFVQFAINKRSPAVPQILSSADNNYSRDAVTVNVTGDLSADLYISLSKPYLMTDLNDLEQGFSAVEMQPFEKISMHKFSTEFAPQDGYAAYYKIQAYSQTGDNAGEISEYSVIVDQYNYFFEENAAADNASVSQAEAAVPDGSRNNPFNNFEQVIQAVNKSQSACVQVKGKMVIPGNSYELTSSCMIKNAGNAQLVFQNESSLCAKNSELSIDNCIIVTDGKNTFTGTKIIPNFKLEKSVLNIKNCQISVNMGKSAVLIDSASSDINITGTIVSLSADTYASIVSGVNTNLNVQNSSLNVTADTCVTYSVNEGNVFLKNNSSKVTGIKGRIGEFFGVKGTVQDNSFKAELTKTSKGKAVYTDKNCSLKETNNEQYGF